MASAGQTPAAAVPAPPRREAVAGVAGVLRKLLGLASLAGVVAGTGVIVSCFASQRSVLVPSRYGGMPSWLRGPLSGTGYLLTPYNFGHVVMVMIACYLVALLCAPALHVRWIVAAIVAIHALLVLGPPLLSSDVFGYLDWARMGALHGLNPYSHDSGSVVSDAVYPFVRWHSLTSPYGPLFTLLSYAIVPLGLAGSFWALKVLTVGASLGCVALIYRICETLDLPPKPAILLYGLNPAVIVYAVGGFHNDVLMMLPLLGGIYLVVSQRERAGAALAASAVAIKASAGLVMPFLILGAHERKRVLTAAVMTGTAVLVVGFIAFGKETLDFLNVLGTQQKLNSGSSVIAQLGSWFGWTGSPTPVRLAASAAGGGATLLCLYRTLRGKDWVTEAGWATLALMVTSSWLLAWYIVWLVPLAAISRSRLLQGGAVGMTLFVILVRIVPFYD
jgi:hypothetical protein